MSFGSLPEERRRKWKNYAESSRCALKIVPKVVEKNVIKSFDTNTNASTVVQTTNELSSNEKEDPFLKYDKESHDEITAITKSNEIPTANNATTTTSINNKHVLRGKTYQQGKSSGNWSLYFYYDKLRTLGSYKTRVMADAAYDLLKTKLASQESYNETKEIDELMFYIRRTIRGTPAYPRITKPKGKKDSTAIPKEKRKSKEIKKLQDALLDYAPKRSTREKPANFAIISNKNSIINESQLSNDRNRTNEVDDANGPLRNIIEADIRDGKALSHSDSNNNTFINNTITNFKNKNDISNNSDNNICDSSLKYVTTAGTTTALFSQSQHFPLATKQWKSWSKKEIDAAKSVLRNLRNTSLQKSIIINHIAKAVKTKNVEQCYSFIWRLRRKVESKKTCTSSEVIIYNLLKSNFFCRKNNTVNNEKEIGGNQGLEIVMEPPKLNHSKTVS